MVGRLLTAAIVLIAVTTPLSSGAASTAVAPARAGMGDAFYGTLIISASSHEHTDTGDGTTDQETVMNETTTFSGVLGHFGAELKGVSTAGSYRTEYTSQSQDPPGDPFCDITVYNEHDVEETTITGFSGDGLLSFDHEVPEGGGSDKYSISAPDNTSTTVQTLDSHTEWGGPPDENCPPPADDHESETSTGRGGSLFELRLLSLSGTWNTRTSPHGIRKTIHFDDLGVDKLSGTVTWDLSFRCSVHSASRAGQVTCRSLKLKTSKEKTDLLGRVRLTAVPTPRGSSGSTYVFEWRRPPGAGAGRAWTTIHSSESRTYSFKPKIAGVFELRVRETSRGSGALTSDPVSLTVRFPDVKTILNDPDVAREDQRYWELGVAEWTPEQDNLHERCFWWGLDTKTGEYKHTKAVVTQASPGQQDDCRLPDRPSDEPSDEPPLTSQPVWWVAWFHTHPTDQGREPGPSNNDVLRTCQEGTPGILVDYASLGVGVNGQTSVYPIRPPERRYLPGSVTLPCQ